MTRAPTSQQIDHQLDHLKHDKPSARVRSVAYLTAYLDTMLRLSAIPAEHRDCVRSAVDQTRKMFELPELGR